MLRPIYISGMDAFGDELNWYVSAYKRAEIRQFSVAPLIMCQRISTKSLTRCKLARNANTEFNTQINYSDYY